MVHGYHIRLTVVGEQHYLDKEPGNLHNDFPVAIIKDYQMKGHTACKEHEYIYLVFIQNLALNFATMLASLVTNWRCTHKYSFIDVQ